MKNLLKNKAEFFGSDLTSFFSNKISRKKADHDVMSASCKSILLNKRILPLVVFMSINETS